MTASIPVAAERCRPRSAQRPSAWPPPSSTVPTPTRGNKTAGIGRSLITNGSVLTPGVEHRSRGSSVWQCTLSLDRRGATADDHLR